MPYQEALEALYEAFRANGILCKWDEPLANHTTFKIGGHAALSVWPTGRAQLILVLSLWRDFGDDCPLCILGKGSNVLMSDKGFCGLVVGLMGKFMGTVKTNPFFKTIASSFVMALM